MARDSHCVGLHSHVKFVGYLKKKRGGGYLIVNSEPPHPHLQVVNKLKSLYGDLYTNDNVLISGTHTHSAPAGYFQYVMYEIMSLGFINQTLQALVNGIVESINLAHNSIRPGRLLLNSGQLYDASINRSPTAYQLNPPEEKAK